MPAVRGDGMRGLAVFISDIRNCKSKEAEIKRINKEKIISFFEKKHIKFVQSYWNYVDLQPINHFFL